MNLLSLQHNIDCIIFDVDGVLIDVRPSYHKAIYETFSYYTGKTLSQEELLFVKKKAGINNDWESTIVLILIDKGYIDKEEAINYTTNQMAIQQKIFKNPYIDYDDLVNRFEAFYKKFRENEELLLDKGFLNKIKAKYKTAIVTGRPREDLMFSLEFFGIKDYFDMIVDDDYTEDKSKRKPSKEALKYAVDRLKPFKSALYLGDTISDLMMCKHYNRFYTPYVYYIHCDFYGVNEALSQEDIYTIVKSQKQLEDVLF